jgi:hypothetical protein
MVLWSKGVVREVDLQSFQPHSVRATYPSTEQQRRIRAGLGYFAGYAVIVTLSSCGIFPPGMALLRT